MDKFKVEAIFWESGNGCSPNYVTGTWSNDNDYSFRIELDNGLRMIIIQVKIIFQDLLFCLLSLFIFKPKFPIWFSFFFSAFSCVFGNHLSHKCVFAACIIFRDFSFIRSSFETFLCCNSDYFNSWDIWTRVRSNLFMRIQNFPVECFLFV